MPRALLRPPLAAPARVPEPGPAASAGRRPLPARAEPRRAEWVAHSANYLAAAEAAAPTAAAAPWLPADPAAFPGNGARGQRRALYRREDPIVEVHAIIGRDALGDQLRVQRVRSQRVFAHGQRLIPLGIVAEFDCGRAFSGVSHAGVVAGAAHRERGILRQFAVQPIRCVDGGGVGGVTPLRWRQEADGARWRLSLMVNAKSPASGSPDVWFFGIPNACWAATTAGSSTRSCSTDGL